VIDSSAWIEWTRDGVLAPRLEKEIPGWEDCIIPTIVQYELAKWLTREVGDAEADDFIAFSRKCIVVDLDTQIAVLAADVGREHRLPAADAIIYATAIACETDLLTCDAHFEGLEHVVYIRKAEN
jgi:predicted nucleic acid-binding protein